MTPVPVEAKAAPAVAMPPGVERAWPEPTIMTPREAVRPRPSWQSPRYLVPSVAVLGLVVFGIYYAASTGSSSRREAEDQSRRAAVEQQRGTVEQLRTTVVAARDRASKADATALAVAVMSRAQAAQAEGERLSTAGDLAAATQAYRESAERYGEAERLAQVKREQRTAADAARVQMVAAKQRASTDAPDFARALETERQGSALYGLLSFPDATASFRAATELFAKAVPAPEPPKGPSVATTPSVPTAPIAPSPATVPGPANPRAEIRALLDTYVRAIETKNLALLQQVRPGLTADEINRMRAANEIKRSHKVDLKVDEITVNGDDARALGRHEDDIVLKEGQRIRQESKFVYTLKRRPRGWVIQEIREDAVQAPRGTRAPDRGARRP
jgi:hypothetical protein